MNLSRRWIWGLVVAALILLILPIPIAERYSSPTQDGQYATNPIRAYRFVFAAARVSPSSELNTSGEALDRAKTVFRDSAYRPNKVELLFLPGDEEYQYTTRDGQTMRFREEGSFVWEVWGELGEGQASTLSAGTTASGDENSETDTGGDATSDEAGGPTTPEANGSGGQEESANSTGAGAGTTEGDGSGTTEGDTADANGADVIGFLEYATGDVLETLDEPATDVSEPQN
ncbi:MAG TPA: hypothetical protein VFE20_02435 [Thermoleophilia bacterium]|nr:hypothetical protein [Thermoleophilia bacterium]